MTLFYKNRTRRQPHLGVCALLLISPQEGPVLCERTSQISLSYQNIRHPVWGKPEKGVVQLSIFYYLPLLLNSMGGAEGLWHCSQKHGPCQAEFAPSQVLIDCERKIVLPGSSVLGKILPPLSRMWRGSWEGEHFSSGSR